MSSDSSPIRIGFVVHVMQVAGAEVLVAETIRRLGARLIPAVLCLDDLGVLGERLVREGVPVVALGRRPGIDFAVAGRLANEIERRQLQVLHAHQYTPFFYTALARWRTRHRFHVMFTEHGRHYPDVVSWRRRVFNKYFLARQANEINAVCGFSARSLAEVDGFDARRIEVIENGIDPERYAPVEDLADLRRRLGLDPSRRYIICVARFHPVKDHAMLLEGFAQVAGARADVDLLLAGDGPLRGNLEGQARNSGIASRVRFLGVRRDVPDLLRAADIFALTSVSEAASLTLMEAMAAGLPVVVTNVGGNPEIVRQGVDGLLVPRRDAKAAADAFLALLADSENARLMGRAGRARANERYRLDRTVSEYFARYVNAARASRHTDRMRS